MPYRFLNFGPQFFDSSGDVLSGGKLYFKESGSDTLKNTYQESGLSTPNSNPVVLDSAGRAAVNIFLDGTYRVELRDSSDTLIWQKDPVQNPTAAGLTLAEVLASGSTSGSNDLEMVTGQKIKTNTIAETTAASGVTVDGVLIKDGGLTLASGAAFNSLKNENDMASNSTSAVASQASIKAFVEAQVGAADTLAEVLANGNTTGSTNISVNAGQSILVDTISEKTAAAGVTIDSVKLKDGDVTVGTGAEADSKVVFDGHAQDYYVGLDDSADALILGLGSAVGTPPAITVASSQHVAFAQNIDVDGTSNLDAVDIDGAVQIDGAVTVGVDDTGYDFKLFGATSGAYLLWDESADKLLTAGGAVVDIVKDKLMIDSTAVTTTANELNVLDGLTADTAELNKLDGVTATTTEFNYLDVASLGTTEASKVVTADANGVVTHDAGISEEYTEVTSSSAAVSINLQLGNNFSHDLTEDTTVSFANPATSGKVTGVTLRVIQTSPAKNITWHSSIKWAGGTAPTLSTGNNEEDIFVFFTVDGGSKYYAMTAGQAMA